MQQPDKITTFQHKDQTFKVKIFSNVDKTSDFHYYTFDFGITKIVISKFDGDQWKIANTIVDDGTAEMLATLLGPKK